MLTVAAYGNRYFCQDYHCQTITVRPCQVVSSAVRAQNTHRFARTIERCSPTVNLTNLLRMTTSDRLRSLRKEKVAKAVITGSGWPMRVAGRARTERDGSD